MAQNLDIDDKLHQIPDFTDEPQREEIPETPAPTKAAGRKRGAYPKALPKEFDIRAAHLAWKERNGIDDEYPW